MKTPFSTSTDNFALKSILFFLLITTRLLATDGQLPTNLPICYDTKPQRWQLLRFFELYGAEAVDEYLLNYSYLIGIVTIEGLDYSRIYDVAEIWMAAHPEILITYVTPELIKAVGINHFQGLILAGGAANYPETPLGSTFNLKTLRAHNYRPLPNEGAYQIVLNLAKQAQIPTLAICLGAQQAALYLGASLIRVSEIQKNCSIEIIKNTIFANIIQTRESFNGYRRHRFAIQANTLPPEAEIGAFTEDGLIMAFTLAPWLFAVQFHPEARYQGLGRFGTPADRAINSRILDDFFTQICGFLY